MHFLSPRLLPLSSGNSNKSLKNLNPLLKRHAFFKLTYLRLLDTIYVYAVESEPLFVWGNIVDINQCMVLDLPAIWDSGIGFLLQGEMVGVLSYHYLQWPK